MSSIVLDLQQDILKSDCDIVNALRKAHLIASKLGLKEFDQWILNELNGYSQLEQLPSYRILRGALKYNNPYNGWCSFVISDAEAEKRLCNNKVTNSISEIISLSKDEDSRVGIQLSGETQRFLNAHSGLPMPVEIMLELPTTALGDIVEKVKNNVLEWTLRLEQEGILGEGMQFNSEEKEKAAMVPQTINNIFYAPANVVNAPVDHSAVVAGNNNTVSFSYDAANDAVAEIETALRAENISLEDRESALEMLTDIRNKIDQQKKPGIIKALLVGLKDFLIGVGASATVAVLQNCFMGLS